MINTCRTVLLVGFLCVMAVFGPGCSRSSMTDPRLEIRNFQISQETTSYGGRTFAGKGEVVVTEPGLSATPMLVFLKERRVVPLSDSGQEVREDERPVVVRGGRGVITTHHYVTSDEMSKGRGGEPTYEWTLIGWAELKPGSVKYVK